MKFFILKPICIALFFMVCTSSAFAQGGTTGPLTWNYHEGTLTISGDGEMPDYDAEMAPWYFSREYLTNVIVENGVTSIGNYAFYNCLVVNSVSLTDDILWIGNNAFAGCKALAALDLPSDITVIEEFTFAESGLITITLPSGVTDIGERAFAHCTALNSILLSDNLTTIGTRTFTNCKNLSSIDLPDGLIYIGAGAFSESGLISIVIPSGVTLIEWDTFGHCTELTTVSIPSSIIEIQERAFQHCASLTSFTNLNPVPVDISSNVVFPGVVTNDCLLIVPTSSVADYQVAEIWKDFNIVGGGKLVFPKSNNSEYGYVTGNGLYEGRAIATVTAFSRNGFCFVNWTKDGTVVSTHNSYTFTVTEDVELIANFEKGVKTIISGKIVPVSNPCLEEPCPPGIVYAIETDSINYIITLKGYWVLDLPIIIDTYSFEWNDPITAEGIISVKQDMWGNDYHEIEILSVVLTSIDENDKRNALSLFPNPTTGKIYTETEISIKVYNLQGVLLQETFGNHADLTAYPQGIYLIKVNDRWSKVVKE